MLSTWLLYALRRLLIIFILFIVNRKNQLVAFLLTFVLPYIKGKMPIPSLPFTLVLKGLKASSPTGDG